MGKCILCGAVGEYIHRKEEPVKNPVPKKTVEKKVIVPVKKTVPKKHK